MSGTKAYVLIISIIIVTILTRAYYAYHNPMRDSFKNKVGTVVSLEGKIIDEPIVKDFLKTFTLVSRNGERVRVGSDRYGLYDYGDLVEVTGKLSSPRNFSSNDGRVFDYINYLGKDEIYFEFKKAKVEIIKKNDKSGIFSILFDFKKRFLNNLGMTLGEPHAALAGGLVVGEKAALGKDLIDDFRKSGLIHIVVLSGYNITIISTMIRRVLAFLPRNSGIMLGGVGIVLFGILVGGGATVVRSCIMAIIALFAEFLRKDYDVSRALYIAALLMLIENPLIVLYDPSFQLSFLATLGLITLSSPIEKKLGFITEKLGIRALVASTLATQVFVSPLIFYMMGSLSLVGTLVNIVVLPFIPITMLLVFLSGIVGFVSYHISQVIAWGAHILLSYELFVVRNAAKLPFATVSIPAFSSKIVIGVYILYLSVFFYTKSRPKSFSQ